MVTTVTLRQTLLWPGQGLTLLDRAERSFPGCSLGRTKPDSWQGLKTHLNSPIGACVK